MHSFIIHKKTDRWWAAVLTALMLCVATASVAQAEALLVDKKALTLEAAEKIAAGALAEARANSWNVVIAIVDEGGHLITLHRMETAQLGSIEVAIGKARTAALFRRPSKFFEESAKTRPAIVSLPNAVILEGGVPVQLNGQTLGAVGVSGATSAQDAQVAEAGIRSAALGR